MTDRITDRDDQQTDEDILTNRASDEALEAAAGTETRPFIFTTSAKQPYCVDC